MAIRVRSVISLDTGSIVSFAGYKEDGQPRHGIVSSAWLSKRGIPCMTIYRVKDGIRAKKVDARCYHIAGCDELRIINTNVSVE